MRKIFFTGMLAVGTVAAFGQPNTLPNNGDVGIGTTTPSQKLTVIGKMNIEDPTLGNYLGFGIPNINEYNTIGSLYSSAVLTIGHGLKPHPSEGTLTYSFPTMSRSAIEVGGFGANGIRFYTKGVSTETVGAAFTDPPRMMISNSGKVGIGTNNPESPFYLQADANTSGAPANAQVIIAGGTHPEKRLSIAYNTSSNYAEMQSQVYAGAFTPIVLNPNGGDVTIGTPDSKGYKLAVNGKVRAHEIKVETANWPDYVFEQDYRLLTLQEIEKHIKDKGHLPGIPSAAEAKTNGIDLGEMNAKLLQKIEELTLHLIEKDKKLNEDRKIILNQEERLRKLECKIGN
ncbi:hypothetical protein [Pedobacter africanus]|uniref:Chaperone of endosialidase n=1 Tax=Pedobacter africanus TaxID=151894 RepID=A0A1W2EF15_9SPHI|nr:hypothetical protein [Pedobacter africanus]SMD08319.1 hypothetical protein SAMN04488524_4751 [Pedobacter africanus]